jgi:hypothetical protein
MTNKAKHVCGKLGICWHERSAEDMYRCAKCGQIDGLTNPTFRDPAGIWQLLRAMRERKDWLEFLTYTGFFPQDGHEDGSWIEEYILDDTGKLLDAVEEWFRKEEGNE